MAALQSNFFITNLMEVLKRSPDTNLSEDCTDAINGVATGQPLSCPNHGGNVRITQQHSCVNFQKSVVYRRLTVWYCMLEVFSSRQVAFCPVFAKGEHHKIISNYIQYIFSMIFCSPFPSCHQVMEFYCPPCETAMCEECTSAEHAEHATVPLKDVLEQHKASLQEQLDAVKSRHVTCAHVHIAI